MAMHQLNEVEQRIADTYAEKLTVNLEKVSSIAPEDYWKTMHLISTQRRAFINYNLK